VLANAPVLNPEYVFYENWKTRSAFQHIDGEVAAQKTAIGNLPAPGTIDLSGLPAASPDLQALISVDAARMRANIDATRGVIFAERAMMLLGEKLGRDVAHKVLEEAARQSVAQGRHLAEVLGEMPEVTRLLERVALQKLESPEEYLGSADAFRRRLLASAEKDAGTK